jgi:hypothetical protein
MQGATRERGNQSLESIDWYNSQRGHSSHDGKTPEQVWLVGLPEFKEVA